MDTAEGEETLTVLRRLIRYAEKTFHLSRDVMAPLSDRRLEPRISTAAVVKSAVVLFWARLGSLNAWALVAGARFWKSWLQEPTCSADSLGRIHARLNAEALRQGIHHLYERLKRHKALPEMQVWASRCWTATKATPVTGVTVGVAGSAPSMGKPGIAFSPTTGTA